MGPFEKITGFEWDKGNEHKNVKHGVTPAEAEQVFLNEPLVVLDDLKHSDAEQRYHALGQTGEQSSGDSIFNSRGTTLTAVQAGSVAPDNQNDFWLIKLGASRLLTAAFSAGGIRKFRFRLTGASELQAAQNWSDLSERYASFVEKSAAAI